MEYLEHAKEPDELYVLWTSGDREVALKMVFMYTMNSRLKAWWTHVTLIIWGPSARLLTEDEELQEKVRAMLHVGVAIVACKACSDSYGASLALEGLGVEVKYMGQPLTQLLKEKKTLITF
ncbi:MAG: DsrE family protein [Negativicutes bacterium]